MRTLALLFSGALLCTACGEDPVSPAAPAGAAPREELLQALFESQEEKALQAAIAAARAGGVSEQAILEARFVNLVDAGNEAAIGGLAPDLEKAAPEFDPADSAIFTQKEEFLAIVEYAHALAALEQGDQDRFKKHIKEAFWLSPNQGPAFAPHIERFRLAEAMARLKLDYQRPLTDQNTGQPLTLDALAGDATHVLLHFWSPWSEECAVFLDDFIATSTEVSKNGVTVVSILSDSTPEALGDANEFVATAAAKARSRWVLDHPKQPFSRELRVMNVPTFVLVHRDGRVLFNGHPAEKDLWNQLQKAVPTIKRPALTPDGPAPETVPEP